MARLFALTMTVAATLATAGAVMACGGGGYSSGGCRTYTSGYEYSPRYAGSYGYGYGGSYDRGHDRYDSGYDDSYYGAGYVSSRDPLSQGQSRASFSGFNAPGNTQREPAGRTGFDSRQPQRFQQQQGVQQRQQGFQQQQNRGPSILSADRLPDGSRLRSSQRRPGLLEAFDRNGRFLGFTRP